MMMKLLLCNLYWLIYVCKEKVTCCFHDFYHDYDKSAHSNTLLTICMFVFIFFIFYFFRHHTVTRGITKGVKEDFRLAMERQVSRCGENLFSVLHRFCINEKIIIIQSLP